MATGLAAPEIPQTQNPAIPFLSAFYASAQINAKRRQLEEQMMKMDMQNKMAEDKLHIMGLNYQSLDNLRRAEAAKAEVEKDALANKANKAIEASQDQKVWDVGLSQITSKPGTKNYLNDLSILRQQAQRYLVTPEGKSAYQQALNYHKETAKEIVDSHVGVAKAYEGFLKDDKLNGRWLENPDQWDYVDANGKSTTPLKATKRVLKLDASLQPLPPDSTDHAYTRTLPRTRFDQVLKLKGANDKIASDVVTGIEEPDVGAAVVKSVEDKLPDKVKVKSPSGQLGMIPRENLQKALSGGYTLDQ